MFKSTLSGAALSKLARKYYTKHPATWQVLKHKNRLSLVPFYHFIIQYLTERSGLRRQGFSFWIDQGNFD